MLLDILKMVKEETGIKYDTSPPEKNLAIARINRAALEIHTMFDLHNSISEEVFDINQGSQQVSLPNYVGLIRGCRYFDNRQRVPIEAGANRYQSGFGNEVWYLKFREKEDSVLFHEISNQSILTFTLPIVETNDINIFIIGRTSNSTSFKEQVVIKAGTLSASSIGNYKDPLISLRKSATNLYDISITDIEGVQLAIFPNSHLGLIHRILQVAESPYIPMPNSMSALEIQYKKRYQPLVDDTDVFICGSIYDFAIFNKYMEHRARTTEAALAWTGKCNQLIGQIWDDLKAGKREQIDFIPGPYFNPPYVYNKFEKGNRIN